jgi:mono/diheme cytochrome c family protein
MRAVILTLLTVALLAVAGAFSFIYAGIYDVSATRPHWPITYWAMDTVRVHSVRIRADGIMPPPGLMDDARIVEGAAHFAAHCASCHGAPGVPRGNLGEKLYPRPADLRESAHRYSPGELFWIVKNGIKMSGMPAWSDHSDDELWSTVSFIEKLPSMSEADYAKFVVASLSHASRHNHGGSAGMPDMPGMAHGSMPGMPTMLGMDHGAPPGIPPPASDGHQSQH